MTKSFQKWLAFWKKPETEDIRWWSRRMDIEEQKNRICSYFMGGYCQSLKFKWRTKEKKYECTSKMVL